MSDQKIKLSLQLTDAQLQELEKDWDAMLAKMPRRWVLVNDQIGR